MDTGVPRASRREVLWQISIPLPMRRAHLAKLGPPQDLYLHGVHVLHTDDTHHSCQHSFGFSDNKQALGFS